MKFGPIQLDDAEGAILGHTLRLSKGVLKKGRRLSQEDVERLRRDGIDTVVGAVLGPGDVHEDEAAARVAEAATGNGVRMADAATGRANLYAAHRGLLVVERDRIDALNLVDEAITIATLAPYKLVDEGDMVATVKIIPFSVEAHAVDTAAERAAGLLKVAPLKPHRAGLILTELSGTHASQLDKAAKSQRQRLSFLGSELAVERRVAHDTDTLAKALDELLAGGLDPVLMLGASAIVDRNDVLPAAIDAVGGRVEHLGIPVDPGNLLCLGRRGHQRIVGVPGCARSLKPSGYDWVLQRIAADLPVTRAEVMRMGAGGLLKDDPERPHPRRAKRARERGPAIAAVVLAAGASRRMGDVNKLLAEVDGKPMVVRAVAAMLKSKARPIIVVTGHEPERVREVVAAAFVGEDLHYTHNDAYADGMSTSVRAGVAAIPPGARGAVFALGDMPWVRASHVDALIDAFDPEGGTSICVPVYDRKRGNPVLWGAQHFGAMRKLTGDMGARKLIQENADEVRMVPVPDGGVLIDVDTPETLARVTEPSD